ERSRSTWPPVVDTWSRSRGHYSHSTFRVRTGTCGGSRCPSNRWSPRRTSGTAGSSPRGEIPDAGRGWAPGSCCSYEPTLTLLEGGLIGPVVVTGGRGRRGAAARAAGPIVTPLGLVHRGGGPAQGRPDLVDVDLDH